MYTFVHPLGIKNQNIKFYVINIYSTNCSTCSTHIWRSCQYVEYKWHGIYVWQLSNLTCVRHLSSTAVANLKFIFIYDLLFLTRVQRVLSNQLVHVPCGPWSTVQCTRKTPLLHGQSFCGGVVLKLDWSLRRIPWQTKCWNIIFMEQVKRYRNGQRRKK